MELFRKILHNTVNLHHFKNTICFYQFGWVSCFWAPIIPSYAVMFLRTVFSNRVLSYNIFTCLLAEWKSHFTIQSIRVENLANLEEVPGHLLHVTCTHRTDTKWPTFSSIFAGFPSGSSNSTSKQQFFTEESERKQNIQPLNVIMMCLDSVSQQAFQRFLPNTTRYLRDELHAAFFEKHTLLGDGTPPGNSNTFANIWWIALVIRLRELRRLRNCWKERN